MDGIHKRRRELAATLERELNELIRMRMQGLVTDQEFVRQKKLVLDQRYRMESKSSQPKNLQQVRHNLAAVTLPLTQLRQTWESLTPLLRTRFHKIVLPVGFVRGQVGTAETCAIFNTFRASAHNDSYGVLPAGIEPTSKP